MAAPMGARLRAGGEVAAGVLGPLLAADEPLSAAAARSAVQVRSAARLPARCSLDRRKARHLVTIQAPAGPVCGRGIRARRRGRRDR